MSQDSRNTKKIVKPAVDKEAAEKISRYAKASYFKEKDKRAASFLKKHPVPGKFLK